MAMSETLRVLLTVLGTLLVVGGLMAAAYWWALR